MDSRFPRELCRIVEITIFFFSVEFFFFFAIYTFRTRALKFQYPFVFVIKIFLIVEYILQKKKLIK